MLQTQVVSPLCFYWNRVNYVDKMVSTLQAQFFVWLASDRKARKILEIGCFSGMKFCVFISDV